MIEYKMRPEDVQVHGQQWLGGWRVEYKDDRGKWHHFVMTCSGVPDTGLSVEAIREHAAKEGVGVDA